MSNTQEVNNPAKGLAGVVVDSTAISKVNPETNSLLYRGYPVQQLAAHKTFEEVAYLLWHGELPDAEQLAQFVARERSLRTLDDDIKRVIDETPVTAHPMDVVRTAVSVIGAKDPNANSADPENSLEMSVRLFAKLPAVVAYDQRRRRGQEAVAPRDDLGFAANLLWMTFGEEPEALVAEVMDVSLTLYAEHSFNASTFTARVIASTTSDLYSAVVGAVGALKGALHGGANEAVMDLLEEIGSPENVKPWLDQALAEKRKIMGFGHRVYKKGDSRVPTMRDGFVKLAKHHGREDLLELAQTLEDEFVERKGIYPNLDFPSGPAYHIMGFDTPTFTPLFAVSRVVGWTAHIMEQAANNALIRPLSDYNGEAEREVPAS